MLTVGPAITSFILDPASDTGVVNQPATFSDNVTSVTSPVLDGVTTAGSTVNVYATSNLAVPVQLNPGPTSGEDVFWERLRPTATAIGASRQMWI